MTTYRFCVWCHELPAALDLAAWSNLLWEAGCDDSSPGIQSGTPCVHFDRDADSLASAIRSAVAAVRSTGVTITRVEILADDLAALETSHAN